MSARLVVLCWDDPRCTAPLHAAAAAYREEVADVRVELALRSLADFNDEPIEQACRVADLVVLDYPMIPRAAEAGVVVEAPKVLAEPVSDEVGTSFDWSGARWAVPVDAACQVAAWRPDLIGSAPSTWDEVRALVASAPGRVAMPMYHSDVLCALLSIAASHGGLGRDALTVGVEEIALLLEVLVPLDGSLHAMAPPAVLAELACGRRWAYCPLVFGYARAGVGTGWSLRWADAPRGPQGIGSVLGGAGLAVTTSASDRCEAARFASWYASSRTQRLLVAPAGGQPATATAWGDPVVDAAVNGFYSRTTSTMLAAVRRPAHPAWPDFSLRAGHLLLDAVRSTRTSVETHRQLLGLAAEVGFPLLRPERDSA